MAGTAAVSAHPGGDDDRGMQRGKAGMGAKMGGQGMAGIRGMGGLRGMAEDFERRETTLQTADGTIVRRVEQGAVDSAAADALSFSLESGEAVTVVIDEDTQVYALEEQEVSRRGWERTRLAPTEVEAEAIEAGAEVFVWSDAEDGAEFVASRVVIQPAEEAEADEAAEAEADEAAAEVVAENAAATDA